MVLDFSAGWCKNCKKIAPLISSLAKQYGQGSSSGGSGSGGVEALVYSVDIDELAEVAVAHDVSTLPRLLFFKVHPLPYTQIIARYIIYTLKLLKY